MEIQSQQRNGIRVLSLSGPMKTGDGDVKLRTAVREFLERGERRFVFDLRGVPWLDSGSLGEIVACRKRVGEAGGDVKLVIKGRAHDLFVMTGLSRAFEVYGDVDEALVAFGTAPDPDRS